MQGKRVTKGGAACGEGRRFFGFLLLFLFFVSAAAAPQAGEAGPWYLISEPELQAIETHLEKSEAERRNWLSQAQKLKAQADSLRTESASLNGQLQNQRERNRALERSFNEYEAGQSTLISSKNGEIADLKQEAADQALAAAACKEQSRNRLFIIAALAGAWVIFAGFKARRFFKLF